MVDIFQADGFIGYISLFAASFLASTLIPFSSEGLMVFLILKKFNILAIVFTASIGNYLGACTSYYIGLKGRSRVIERYLRIDNSQIQKAEVFFKKYGSYALLLSWLPLIGDALVVSSGLLRLQFKIFSLLVFIGKFLRYFAFAYLAGYLL